MKNTTMSLSDFRAKINTALLKRIGAGEERITLTSHGFPLARVGAINPAWDGRPFIDPVVIPEPGQAIQWHEPVDITESAEDAADIKAACESLAELGRSPWNEVKEELGLDTGEGPSEDGANWVKPKSWKPPLDLKGYSLEALRNLLLSHADPYARCQILGAITVTFINEATSDEFAAYREANAEIRKDRGPCDDGT